MSTPAFTPAPWHRIGHRTIAAGARPYMVTICEVFSGSGTLEEADANEALIAAAPALYEAAEAAASVLAKVRWRSDSPDPEAVALRKLLGALSAAKGSERLAS